MVQTQRDRQGPPSRRITTSPCRPRRRRPPGSERGPLFHLDEESPGPGADGDGGGGKTWLGYCLLIRASSDEAVSLLVESPGSERDALSDAAARFWNEIVGHEDAPPFVNLRRRLRSLGDAHKDREVCILFDGIAEADLARRLVLEPWDKWGVRVILTCPNELAPMLRSTVGEYGTVVTVGDFSAGELHEYLAESVGPGWPSIPHEVRNTLRRPLLARLYRDTAESAEWQPTREYDLYQRCWDDLVNRRGVRDLDLVPLMAAALTLLGGAPYPWSRDQLVAAGMSPDSLESPSTVGVGQHARRSFVRDLA